MQARDYENDVLNQPTNQPITACTNDTHNRQHRRDNKGMIMMTMIVRYKTGGGGCQSDRVGVGGGKTERRLTLAHMLLYACPVPAPLVKM
jgi:hypothetical protein